MFAFVRGDQALFVLINVATNLLLLARSYVTMRVLDYTSLGLVAFIQSTMVLVGTLQFGFINGGYRLLCSADAEGARRINDFLYTVLGLLAAGALLVSVASAPFLHDRAARLALFLGAIGGIFTLARTWIQNQMIALAQLRQLNRLTVETSLASLAVLVLIPANPVAACIASLLIQPALFLLALIRYPVLRPRRLRLERQLGGTILAAGFTLFLTGIAIQVNAQIERWYVVQYLGLAALGHLYLSFLFITLFQLAPTSFGAIFMTRIIRAHDRDDHADVSREMKQQFALMLGYCSVTIVALKLFAPFLVALLLPRYQADLRYVGLIAPGILLFALAGVLATIFNVLVRYRTYVVSYGVGSLVTVGAFAMAISVNRTLSLDEVTIIKSAAYSIISGLLCVGFWRMTIGMHQFRFLLLPR
jgi:O-antigen/teichoic acid export membrane protein